jgi:hypothetical protein
MIGRDFHTVPEAVATCGLAMEVPEFHVRQCCTGRLSSY